LRNPPSGIGVEKLLSQFESDMHDARRPMQLAAVRYYLQLALWNCEVAWEELHHNATNYCTVVDKLEQWRLQEGEEIVFVTFNYDTMLEKALAKNFHREIEQFDHYLFAYNFKIIKLHGSINWGLEVDSPLPAHTGTVSKAIIDMARTPHQLIVSKDYRIVKHLPMPLLEDGRALFPALAIPVENKFDYVCPTDHVQELYKALPRVRKVITIGWRGVEMDFLLKLPTSLAAQPALMIISDTDNSATETHANLLKGGAKFSRLVGGVGGFSKVILGHQIEDFLQS
jgi:UDP-2,3-diacylglucosamine pyrophosphatase LpxH